MGLAKCFVACFVSGLSGGCRTADFARRPAVPPYLVAPGWDRLPALWGVWLQCEFHEASGSSANFLRACAVLGKGVPSLRACRRTALMVHLKTAAARNGEVPLKTMALSCSLSSTFQQILLFCAMSWMWAWATWEL
jgi:hypothetical protein